MTSFAADCAIYNFVQSRTRRPLKPDKAYLQLLIRRVIETDDEKSFEKLFQIFYSRLVTFSAYFIHSRELAEEIVSEVFVKLWNKRKGISGIENIEAYLFTAVKNQTLNNVSAVQYSSIRISEDQQPELKDLIDIFDPEKELELQELQFSVNLAIESLSPQCKVIFKMIREDGLRYKEVASILNVSPRTVETQLMRALKRLDSALSPFMEKKLRCRSSGQSQTLAQKIKKSIFSIFL